MFKQIISRNIKDRILIADFYRKFHPTNNLSSKLIYLPPSKYEDKFLKHSYELFNESYKGLITSFDDTLPYYKKTAFLKLEQKIKSVILSRTSVDSKFLQNLNRTCTEEILLKKNLSEALKLFSAWHILCGGLAFRGDFFEAILNIYAKNLRSVDARQTVLVLFFLSQSNSNRETLISDCLSSLEIKRNEISLKEWSLICHCCFRLNKKIQPKVLNLICELVIKNRDEMDSYTLLAIVKQIRLANYYHEDYLRTIKSYIKKNIQNMNFVECSHLLAAFANEGCYDRDLFVTVEKRTGEIMQDQLKQDNSMLKRDQYRLHGSVNIRFKDLARYLWSMHHVGHNCSERTYETVKQTLLKMLEEKGFESVSSHHFIDALQSLVLNRIFWPELLQKAFSENVINSCSRMNRVKPLHSLHFLMCSVLVEFPNYLTREIYQMMRRLPGGFVKDTNKEIANRKGFAEILSILQKNFAMETGCYTCVSPLPHIPIAGILIHIVDGKLRKLPENLSVPIKEFVNVSENLTSIEILDESNCVRGTDRPIGFLALKIHQLKRLNFKVVSLSQEDVKLYSNDTNALIKLLL